MATFKVGDKVRLVRVTRTPYPPPSRVGLEYVIAGFGNATPMTPYFAAWDCHMQCGMHAMFEELAPLTDPKADEFIERIKKLEREPQPVEAQRKFIEKIESVVGPLGPEFH